MAAVAGAVAEFTGKELLKISSEVTDKQIVFNYSDDGRGMNVEKLKDKALVTGKWSAKDLSGWSDEQIAKLIFVQGITTSERADMIAGRGMGMSIIREKLDQLKGDIDIRFENNKHCTFRITIPIK